MAYSTSNPPVLMCQAGGGGAQWWNYDSTDVHTTVAVADYFSNGHALGMKVGDKVIVGKTTATIGATVHYVQTVTVGGAATVASAILA